ncbi:GNAT family N-acetyltransferase [Agromyces ramosus]|uniref:Ribosomal protein S18 acetylase RimI-like enzyme n=1 Tax=Agromyces ramosus TaxID=33879 RepID=A0ABU0R4H4_9MICO|nr:GNAT family N-acetyltransferase [Agromyces ramosus]MDQ0892978.1 ribosomal protein S18 acetylase RimI-like enzyme [Agromyces ramosus]
MMTLAGTPFTIGPIRDGEAGAESALIERAFAAGPYGRLEVSAERREFVSDTTGRAASGAVLVARRDGRVVGTASVLRARTRYARVAMAGEAEIRLLAVDPELQGARIGEALMRAALEAALDWGADALVLDTGARNTRAQSLSERLGFVRDPERDAAASADGVDSFVYAQPLQERADVRVRLMRPDESSAVAALVESAYAADFELSDAYRADIAAVAQRARDHQVWVVTDASSGMPLGTASTPRAGAAISPLARDGELDFRFLGVATEARRRGIGELLVRHVLRLARLRGLERVVLNTGPDMVAAQRLYERLGFERLHEREFVFERPDGSSFLMLAYGRDADHETDHDVDREAGAA